MNKRIKIIMGVILFAIICFGCSNIVNAAYTDTFTTTDGIIAKKTVDNYDGDIELKLSNITLESDGRYTWGIGKTSSVDDIEYTANLGDFNSTKKTAIISLTSSEPKILNILKSTNTAYLFVKDEDADSYIVNALKLDLTLPALKAFKVTKINKDSLNNVKYTLDKEGKAGAIFSSGTTYNIKTIYFKFIKIDNKTIISQYHNAKENNLELESIESLPGLDDAPDSGWKTATAVYSSSSNLDIQEKDVPTDAGVYYLWLKGQNSDTKMVYGYTIVEIDADGPNVKEIRVTSPSEGTYKTPQTVTIRVYFDEKITASTVPTLKVRFGNSPVRELKNGTLKNNVFSIGSEYYIEYTYNIQDTDVGQLATVSYEGGNVKDTSENEATLSCPVITGNAIKANVDGTTTNKTDNQDKTNDTTTKVSVEGITIAKTAEVEMGKTITLSVTFSPTNASDKTVTWKSSDDTIATVDSNGKVTPKKVGKVVITATSKDGSKTATCNLTVKAANNSNVKTAEINTTTGTNNSGTSNTSTSTKKDTTTAAGNIPQTGVSMTIVFVIVAVIGIAIVAYTKYSSYKDVK